MKLSKNEVGKKQGRNLTKDCRNVDRKKYKEGKAIKGKKRKVRMFAIYTRLIDDHLTKERTINKGGKGSG